MASRRQIRNCEIAEEFVSHQDFRDDLVFCYGHDTFYLWNNHYYKRFLDEDFRIEVREFIRNKYPNFPLTIPNLRDVIEQIKMISPRRVKKINETYAALKDRYLSLNSFETSPTNKEKIVSFSFPYTLKQILGTEIPTFKNFLKTSLVIEEDHHKTDEKLITYVQEMFGFFLLANLNSAGAFFLLGDGANGKSIMTYVLQEMFTEEYYTAMSIQDMTTDKFAGVNLIGKKINISNEEESRYLRSDKFKAMITGNPIKMEYKFGKSFMYAPRTKYIFASNELPTFDGLNYGIRRRIKIVPFFRRFKETDEDIIPEHLLQQKLKKELPGIIGWAIRGAKRFVENNYVFSVPLSSKKVIRQFENDMSSALTFVRENYKVSGEQWIPNTDLYNEYKEWCFHNGRKHVSSSRFHREIINNIEGIISKIQYVPNRNTTERCKNLEKTEPHPVNDKKLPPLEQVF